MTKRDKCLNPNCDRVARARGLCNSCYQAALKLVTVGDTTWAKLEKAGKVAPPCATQGCYSSKIKGWLLEK